MRTCGVVAVLALSAEIAHGQPARPQFEDASVKSLPTAPNAAGGRRPPFPFSPLEISEDHIATSPGTLTMRAVTLSSCIKWAYRIQDTQIAGPDWLSSDRFDITAKAPRPVP